MPFLRDSAIGFVVGRTSHALRHAFQATFAATGHDITPEEWGILNRLCERDGQRPAQLADATVRDRSTVTRLLDGMVEKGLVSRAADPRDRRALQIWLTPAGKALREELTPVAERLLHRITAGIPARDLRVTMETLRRFQTNMARPPERD